MQLNQHNKINQQNVYQSPIFNSSE